MDRRVRRVRRFRRRIRRTRGRWRYYVALLRRRRARRSQSTWKKMWITIMTFLRSILWILIIGIGITLFFPILFAIVNKRSVWKFALSDEFVDMQIGMQKFWILTSVLTVLLLGNGNVNIPGISTITSYLIILWFSLVVMSIILCGIAYLANIIRCLYEDPENVDITCVRYRMQNLFDIF